MSHSYEELKHKTVAELREIAKDNEHEALKGYTQLNKEHLLAALCKALNVDTHAHHVAEGFDKGAVKTKIKEWKKKRDEAIEAHDRTTLLRARTMIHRLKHKLHKAMV